LVEEEDSIDGFEEQVKDTIEVKKIIVF